MGRSFVHTLYTIDAFQKLFGHRPHHFVSEEVCVGWVYGCLYSEGPLLDGLTYCLYVGRGVAYLLKL